MSQNNYREMYVSEALEHVETINDTLLKLEEEPDKKEHLDLIFRSAHTIKGMSATMGYDDTRELCKNIENIFDNIRKGQEKLTPNLASALFKCIDLLREMIADEKKRVDLKPYLQMLEHPDDAQVDVAEPTNSAKSPTIRVKMLDLDSLVNLVGELVISKMRLEQTLSHNGSDDARQVMTELDRLVTDLQYQSMKLRLVPIDQIFSRFTRLVRDTSTGLGKQVNLIMDGSGIELDRTVLDAITDPLLHILRNCVDHGIETPQERESIINDIRNIQQDPSSHIPKRKPSYLPYLFPSSRRGEFMPWSLDVVIEYGNEDEESQEELSFEEMDRIDKEESEIYFKEIENRLRASNPEMFEW